VTLRYCTAVAVERRWWRRRTKAAPIFGKRSGHRGERKERHGKEEWSLALDNFLFE
jgi:hypothetical protein